ncbi:serpin family protein [Erythrobacter rubeus]|uniref:Serpin family protein n=1 Tax=Erythrobacter rubeus TaxID=2760803 RepID=A0ABR8KZ73_9SPHN|nr:serpin family protein [Erythrobacter rubeus]MBD2843466.1 serpin family protein [Erythrobacter rubeus]
MVRSRRIRRLLPMVIVAPVLAACVSSWSSTTPEASDVTVQEAAEGSNAFALDLYREVANEGDNLFFSPASISLAMGFAYRGADGQTAEEMREVMRFPAGPEAYLSSAGELDRSMNLSGEGRELRSANAFWVHEDLELEPDYMADLEQKASGAFRRVDFTTDPEAARNTINRWVSGKTEDRIEELIAKGVIRPKTAAVLVNAIYWKADWLKPFKAEATTEEPFFMADGSEITANLMNARNDFRGIERGSVKLIELPYAGEEVSMVAILPDDPDGFARLEGSLTASRLERWLSDLDEAEPYDTILAIPKMSLDWSADLGEAIEEMGAPLAFSRNANFDRMARLPQPRLPDWCGLTISNVIHQANIDVDEKGSEAAAATAVVMSAIVTSGRRGPPPPPPFVFRADHPFMFLLRDKRSGAILFMGRLVDPRQDNTDGPSPDLSPVPEVSPAEGCPPKL